jgi:ribosomal protein S27AE
MKTSATITCPKCGNPVIFNLPPQTMGGKTEFCRKCSNMVTVVFSTDRDGNINDLRLT